MIPAIAILMKDPAEAKTRLAPALGYDARERLALILFENTLAFALDTAAGGPVGVVTASPRIAGIARSLGAAVVPETAPGINAAAEAASRWAIGIGAPSLLILHADIPTFVPAEFAVLLDAAPVAIAESRDGGTNALLLTPPDAIPFRFGPGSAAAHAAEAGARGLTARRLRLPRLGEDIDRPEDLAPGPAAGLTLHPVPDLPEIAAGDDLAALIAARTVLAPGDIVVIAQKVVSKAEGRMRALDDFAPSPRAREIATEIGKDPRKVEAILSESSDVLRARRQPPDGLLITRHRHGWICANAGIDESNLGPGREGMLLLLPEDPDASARAIRAGLETRHPGPIGVIVTDTFGRPWRNGLVNIAIGTAGVPALIDWSARTDAYGRGLKATLPALADEIAAAAGLVMQKDAGLPVVVVRGLPWQDTPDASARDVLRPLSQELFQ